MMERSLKTPYELKVNLICPYVYNKPIVVDYLYACLI